MKLVENTITVKLQDYLRGKPIYLNNRTMPIYKINGLVLESPLAHTIQTTTTFIKLLTNETIRTIQRNEGMFLTEQRMIPRQIIRTLIDETNR